MDTVGFCAIARPTAKLLAFNRPRSTVADLSGGARGWGNRPLPMVLNAGAFFRFSTNLLY